MPLRVGNSGRPMDAFMIRTTAPLRRTVMVFRRTSTVLTSASPTVKRVVRPPEPHVPSGRPSRVRSTRTDTFVPGRQNAAGR